MDENKEKCALVVDLGKYQYDYLQSYCAVHDCDSSDFISRLINIFILENQLRILKEGARDL